MDRDVNSLPQLLTDPHLNSVHFWEEREHPTEGTLRIPACPIEMPASPASVRILPQRLGAQTREILGELGLSAQEIDALVAAKAVGVPAT